MYLGHYTTGYSSCVQSISLILLCKRVYHINDRNDVALYYYFYLIIQINLAHLLLVSRAYDVKIEIVELRNQT